MAESAITVNVNVKNDTSELDDLKGIFPTLDNVVENLKSRLNTACGNLSQRIAVQLLEYERMEFNYHKHPYETGVGGNSFYAKDNGDNSWTVDNSAENNGFPYMVTEELGDNPGRKLPPHPFVAPSREVVLDEIEDMWKEVSG
jgi:hypothetical protein